MSSRVSGVDMLEACGDLSPHSILCAIFSLYNSNRFLLQIIFDSTESSFSLPITL